LENVPPGQQKIVHDLGKDNIYRPDGPNAAYFGAPDIELFCPTEGTCEKMQMFQCRSQKDIKLIAGQSEERFVYYLCRNCGKSQKSFGIFWHLSRDQKTGTIFKYGEVPQFGPPNPARLISLLRENKELYLKGRRAENQSMGIAAYAYYRRIIEAQKSQIFDAIIGVCKAYSAKPEIIADLEAAKAERQFVKAIEAVKHGLPEVLFVDGQNPLALLHDALSEGLHVQSDEECLELATDIRMVLGAFAERMGEALREQRDLTESVTRLMRKRQEREKALKAATAAQVEGAKSPA
jgi:hypothetical protein